MPTITALIIILIVIIIAITVVAKNTNNSSLGTPVVPFLPFNLGSPSRKKGTLVVNGLLGNLVAIRRIIVIRRNGNPTKNTNDNHISSNSSNNNMNNSSNKKKKKLTGLRCPHGPDARPPLSARCEVLTTQRSGVEGLDFRV